MSLPTIHLIAPAGSCQPFFDAIGIRSAAELIAIVEEAVGQGYQVSGSAALIERGEDEAHGGRRDDRDRAADIQQALADDGVVAVVLLRGGAWFTRVLPLIDFTVLDRRTRPVAVFGFSELTTLVNIVGASRHGLGIYDMGPAFLTYGLTRYAANRFKSDSRTAMRPRDWMLSHLRPELDAFFQDVIAMIDGRGTGRSITGRVARGSIANRREATFVGGNLTVLSTLVGSPYEMSVRPEGRWLLLEDFNDKLERIDRFLAHLTLARYWDACAGILLGDFHKGYEHLTRAVLGLLHFHVPPGRSVPILLTDHVGHVWPMSPLPLHVPMAIERTGPESFAIQWPAGALRVT
ncbi:MAG: LD-carboxypeptidase [Phycisphaerales bacterium]|nr:MAG: LD-carboxypeptidase [Phycisphaerales bacterium]